MKNPASRKRLGHVCPLQPYILRVRECIAALPVDTICGRMKSRARTQATTLQLVCETSGPTHACRMTEPTSVVQVQLQHQSGTLPAFFYRHCGRAVKEMDSKSIGLCPQGFESPRCRSFTPRNSSRFAVAIFCADARSHGSQ